MPLSPDAQDLRLFQYLAPNTFSQLLAQSPIASHSLKRKRTISSQAIDSGHEEDDADPSPHAQPLASTPFIKSEPHDQSSCSTHVVNATNQHLLGLTTESVIAGVIATPDDDGVPVVGPSSVFSADVEPVDHGYLSDADLPETLFREAQGYGKLSIKEKAVWELKRATKLFEEGRSKHFECLDHLLGGQPCTTLQEYLPSRLTARSLISSFFGHNKGGWNQIPKSVRVFLCRKCYQRRENKLKPHLAAIQLPLCRELVDRLERWRPGCLFTIRLSAALERKVKRFDNKMDKEGSMRRIVAEEIDSESLGGKASRATNTPVLFAIKLDNRFGGINKTTENLRNLFDWLDSKLADGTIEDLPAFEALLEECPQDMERMRTQKESRDALKKTLTMKLPEVASASEKTAESEATPTHRPARAAAKKMPRPAKRSRAINATADPVLTSLSVAPQESNINADTSALAGPSARPKITLKLKVKKPVKADSTTIDSQPRIVKKRKRDADSMSKGSKDDGESASLAKKPKESMSVEEVANVPTVETASDAQAQTTEEQHVEAMNGITELASLTFSNLEIILNFPPGS